MPKRNRAGSLSSSEKRIVKRLLARGWRNQDIRALVNIERSATINSARITSVKQDQEQRLASDEEVDFYLIRKRSYDPKTGLNAYDDERLVRAREAMILAVQVFNSAGLSFKTEVFAVLANISWTYLLHEYYVRKRVNIIKNDGKTVALSEMIEREDCPLSDGVRKNLKDLKVIRDEVEHKLLGRGDIKWQSLFQACCLNFNRCIQEFFGERLSLTHELSFALQFNRMEIDQLAELNKYEIPSHIEALDASLEENLTDAQRTDLEYRFRVIYTLDAASRTRSHIEFLRPESAEGKDVRNVLVQHKLADHLYPHKPSQVTALVSEQSGQRFTTNNHTQAWKHFKVRPKSGAKQPENTNRDFCIYHRTHKDYTYSDAWVEHLIEAVSNQETFEAIKSQKN